MAAAWVTDTGTVAGIWAGYAVIIMGGRIAVTVVIDRQKWAVTERSAHPRRPLFGELDMPAIWRLSFFWEFAFWLMYNG